MTGESVRRYESVIGFARREWLFLVALVAAVVTSVIARTWPVPTSTEIEVLFILWILFVAVGGLQRSGALAVLGVWIESGGFLAFKIVLAAFVLAAMVTNDVAVIVLVPMILALDLERKGTLVILVALAANAGSIMTPFGNPQNLFIYWFYDVPLGTFVRTIAPLGLGLLVAFATAAALTRTGGSERVRRSISIDRRNAVAYGVLLVVVVLAVVRVLPLAVGVLVVAYAAVADRRSLRVDYLLLAMFLLFFVMSGNLALLLSGALEHPAHVFFGSALVSQVMSNVPTAIVFARFTPHWDALVWGVNVGGFGSLIASFANLIAYRFYINDRSTDDAGRFTVRFLVFGYGAFLLGSGIYWLKAIV
jgi:Na+/H+ antiporter NhaD/arsenite permease-like protein